MATKNKLREYHIVKAKSKSSVIFTEHISDDFTTISAASPSKYVKYCWAKYESYASTQKQNNAMNGKVFELIIETCLFREKITPMFLQAKVTFVPNVDFDVICFTEEQYPIAISLKTSLRERYKQADLEAIALKYVHRNAKNYLILLKSDETASFKQKLKKGELLGINEVIAADDVEFDEFVDNMKKSKYINPGKVDIITGNLVK